MAWDQLTADLLRENEAMRDEILMIAGYVPARWRDSEDRTQRRVYEAVSLAYDRHIAGKERQGTPHLDPSEHLSGMDQPILELLDAEGPMFSTYMATRLGVPGKTMGPRLYSLRKRGYVESYVPASGPDVRCWRRTRKAWRNEPVNP